MNPAFAEYDRVYVRAKLLAKARRRRLERWHDGLPIRERALRLTAWSKAYGLAWRLREASLVLAGYCTIEDLERKYRPPGAQ